MTESHAQREIPDLVSIRWDGGPASVAVDPEWIEHMTAAELLQQVVKKAREHLPTLGGETWQDHIDLTKVRIPELREFTALVNEARRESADAPRPSLRTVKSRHLESRWIGESLLSIVGDEAWLNQASRQALSDEFVAVLEQPEAEGSGRTVARERFIAFMKER